MILMEAVPIGTGMLAALVAGVLEPPEFTATTETVNVFPMSPPTATWLDPVAPDIMVPARFHW
jgi:hypothetical protein